MSKINLRDFVRILWIIYIYKVQMFLIFSLFQNLETCVNKSSLLCPVRPLFMTLFWFVYTFIFFNSSKQVNFRMIFRGLIYNWFSWLFTCFACIFCDITCYYCVKYIFLDLCVVNKLFLELITNINFPGLWLLLLMCLWYNLRTLYMYILG